MKILYGVQATGNGHITRARTMATELANANIEVDYLFSGRDCDKLFNMEVFGDYRCLSGLTFATQSGRIQYLKTAMNNNIFKLVRDIRGLDLEPYDLVITDFEPITAWAARLKRKSSVGIGHQYAFQYDIPIDQANPLAQAIIRHFAPAKFSLGLHWHHFDHPILPPMTEPIDASIASTPEKILVYLPFDEISDIVNWLRPVDKNQFYIYCNVDHPSDEDHLHLRPFSRQGFLDDLATSSGVISNAGFELLSEALQFGKKLLVKPLKGQMEQASNAKALLQLGYGDMMTEFDSALLRSWLAKQNPSPRHYPNVAQAIVSWIINGMHEDEHTLSRQLWSQSSSQQPVQA